MILVRMGILRCWVIAWMASEYTGATARMARYSPALTWTSVTATRTRSNGMDKKWSCITIMRPGISPIPSVVCVAPTIDLMRWQLAEILAARLLVGAMLDLGRVVLSQYRDDPIWRRLPPD